MKRLFLSPETADNSQEHTSHLSDDVTMPTLTIRYPPVFDDDVACQQYQYQHQRRPSYRPSLYQTDQGAGSFPCDSQQPFGHSGWPRTGDFPTDPYEQAVDFSMNRSASQEPAERVHITPPSLTLATRFRTTTSTPCRLPQAAMTDNSGHLYSDRPPHLPYVPQDETDNIFSLPHRSTVSCASAGDTGVGGAPESLLQQCENTGSLTGHRPHVPADLRAGIGYESPTVQWCPEQIPERLVYYDMDTPQREVAEAMTPQVQIKEETCDVPLQMRALLPSNKGASKQRRDQINAEIAIIRDLLPLAESARQRLSQLQIMSLSCVYIRKCNILEKLFRSSRLTNKDNLCVPSCDFFQSLTGFLLITTREGKLVYISENVTDYLGHSMVDMKTQGDSLYDIVDKRDHGTVQAQLLQAGTDGSEATTRDVAFFCRMNMSRSLKRQAGFGDVKVMYVKGHFVPYPGQESSSEQQLVFMGMCTPLITPDLKENLIQNNTMVFKTVHQLDLSFLEVSHTAEYHLGYSNGELFRRSWYGMLHPEDLQEAREKHVQLIRSNHEMGCMMIVRMIRADNTIFWVNVVMHIKQASVSNSDDPVIMCVNQVISEQEAYQFKLQSQMFQFYPPRTEPWQQTVPCPSMATEQDTRWLQPSGFPATSRMRTTQAGPVFSDQTSCQTGPFMPYIDPRLRRGDQLKNGGSCQTERLKDMLRRKIKGPCRPAKVPRMSLNGNDDKSSGQGFDFGSSNYMIPNLENFSESFPALAVAQGGWADSTQVMSQSNYSVPAVALQQKKNILLEPSSMSPASMLQEQVVPDVSALPDSYLTPDPSPASSPDNCKPLKVDILSSPRSTKTIIQELEQLANMTGRAKVKPEIVSQPLPPTPTKKRKELPVIDPLEIESYFGNFEKVARPNTQCLEDIKISLPIPMQKKVDHVSVKPKKNLPLIDAIELEELFNNFNGECNPYIDAEMLVDSAGAFFEEPALLKEEDPCTATIKVECTNSPASQSMSPRSMASCDLSEEDELLEELVADPMEMTLSVTVKDEFMPVNAPKPSGSFEADELYQLLLLSSIAPQNGAIALSEETQ